MTCDAQARVDDRAVAPMFLSEALKLGRLDEAVILRRRSATLGRQR
jgi:hypothetical protein